MNEPAFSGLERLSPSVDASLLAGVSTVVGIVIPQLCIRIGNNSRYISCGTLTLVLQGAASLCSLFS
jgi:hypothetical protein